MVHSADHRNCAVADRGATTNGRQYAIHCAVMSGALDRQPQVAAAENVVPAKILYRRRNHDRKIRWRSRKRCRNRETSAPALVVAVGELGDLTELCASPLERELYRCVAQARSPLPRTAHANRTGVAEVEISPYRLRLQAHAPCIFRVLPQGKICLSQCVRFLFRAKLEIYPAAVGLDVGEPGTLFSLCFARGRNGNFGGSLDKIFEIPMSFFVPDKVEARFRQVQARDF